MAKATIPRDPRPSPLRLHQQDRRHNPLSQQGHRPDQDRLGSRREEQQKRGQSVSSQKVRQKQQDRRQSSSSQGRAQRPQVGQARASRGQRPQKEHASAERGQKRRSQSSSTSQGQKQDQQRRRSEASTPTRAGAKRPSRTETVSTSLTGSVSVSSAETSASHSSCSKRIKWWHGIFVFCAISLLVCLLQLFLPPPFGLMQTTEEVAANKAEQQRTRMLGVARHPHPVEEQTNPFLSSDDGCADGLQKCICPRETICADTTLYMILLALARCSAFFDYPLYMMMFLSKAHNINNALRRTALREWVDFADMHRIHQIFGVVVGVETMFHSFFHLLRWGLRGDDIQLLWQSRTGVSGLIACLATPLIVWPMVIPWLKKRMSFELRKGLHYLSWPWALALVFHAPARIYWLIGIPALIYLVDFIFGFFLTTHLIETVAFERYGQTCVVADIENPKGFEVSKTSFVYIMCPWISKFQWHAFTIFPHPTKPNHSTLCISVAGDWTKQLYSEIWAPSLKPVYVLGPLRSEFSDVVVSTTNAIAIASGIGITPTLSLMLSYNGKKRINIIWACRDPGLVEYFLYNVDLSAITKHSFALIYYTGSRELDLPRKLPPNFFIFRTRPDLEQTISGIVSVIESREGLPEEMYENQRTLADIPVSQRIKIALIRVITMYSREVIFDYAIEKTEQARPHDLEASAFFHAAAGRVPSTSTSSRASTKRCEGPSMNEEHKEELGGLISREGLEETILDFLGGVREYTSRDMEALRVLFSQVDKNGWGYVDKAEFYTFLDLATDGPKSRGQSGTSRPTRPKTAQGAMRSQTRSSTSRRRSISAVGGGKRIEPTFGGDDSIDYLRKLSFEKDGPLKNWSMFYCGASTPIENNLKDIKKKYGIRIAVEKFNW